MSNYRVTTTEPNANGAELFDADAATPDDLARMEALIAAEEEKAEELDARIKALEEQHGIADLKEARKGHKDEAARLTVELRKAVRAGGEA